MKIYILQHQNRNFQQMCRLENMSKVIRVGKLSWSWYIAVQLSFPFSEADFTEVWKVFCWAKRAVSTSMKASPMKVLKNLMIFNSFKVAKPKKIFSIMLEVTVYNEIDKFRGKSNWRRNQEALRTFPAEGNNNCQSKMANWISGRENWKCFRREIRLNK